MLKKVCLSILMVVLCLTGGFAMIQTLSVDELVKMADLIAIAKLKEIKPTDKSPEGFQKLENTIVLEEILKGEEKKGDERTFITFSGLEDNPTIASDGLFLIFLTKTASQTWDLTNLIQGYWPFLKDGRLGGMGLRYNLDIVKQAINKK
ncbi:MAG: hypothetical protein HQM08_15275 [Candidatus Riflebacteria bacterium]|nr:hypothetical protein [Candidatus Riflebacteria bacterium]